MKKLIFSLLFSLISSLSFASDCFIRDVYIKHPTLQISFNGQLICVDNKEFLVNLYGTTQVFEFISNNKINVPKECKCEEKK